MITKIVPSRSESPFRHVFVGPCGQPKTLQTCCCRAMQTDKSLSEKAFSKLIQNFGYVLDTVLDTEILNFGYGFWILDTVILDMFWIRFWIFWIFFWIFWIRFWIRPNFGFGTRVAAFLLIGVSKKFWIRILGLTVWTDVISKARTVCGLNQLFAV